MRIVISLPLPQVAAVGPEEEHPDQDAYGIDSTRGEVPMDHPADPHHSDHCGKAESDECPVRSARADEKRRRLDHWHTLPRTGTLVGAVLETATASAPRRQRLMSGKVIG